MQTAQIYIHPTACNPAALVSLQSKTGLRAVVIGRSGRLIESKFNPKPAHTPTKAARTQHTDTSPWGGDAA